MGALPPVLVNRETSSRSPRRLSRILGSLRGAVRDKLVEAPTGGLFFPWGKI